MVRTFPHYTELRAARRKREDDKAYWRRAARDYDDLLAARTREIEKMKALGLLMPEWANPISLPPREADRGESRSLAERIRCWWNGGRRK